MSCFSKVLSDSLEYSSIANAIDKKRLPMGVLGLSPIHKAHLFHVFFEEKKCKAVVLTSDEASAQRLVQDMTAMGSCALYYPARDFSFRSAESQSREYEHMRIATLSAVLSGEYDAVVCSVEAFMQYTIAPNELRLRTMKITSGEEISIENIIKALLKAGYIRSVQVDGTGQFAVRGGILDFFPSNSKNPVRIEFWGDTVDTITLFDPESQRRTDIIQEISITPATEVIFDDSDILKEKIQLLHDNLKGKGSVKAKALLLEDIHKITNHIRISSMDKYLPIAYERSARILDYLSDDDLLFVCDSYSVKERAKAIEQLFSDELKSLFEEGVLCKGLDKFMITFDEVVDEYKERKTIYADNIPRGSFDTPVHELVSISAHQNNGWNGSAGHLAEDLSSLKSKNDSICVILAGTEKGAKALSDDLTSDGFKSIYLDEYPEEFKRGIIYVLQGAISAGMEYPLLKFKLVSYAYQRNLKKSSKHKAFKKSNSFNSLEEMHIGDYIVHSAHGIGIYEGITSLKAGDALKDYIKIKYDKADVLYVPVTQLDMVSKYIGPRSETHSVKLNKLGSDKWQKTKNKVRSAVKDMADELIVLYSKRMNLPGYQFSPDIDMQNDFERRFEFEETEDQLRCIHEIKKDMEKPYPMDRLLCGDVGFGKTEVALRGAFKCIADGKQCAILVPTTILALQHYQTIMKRFEGFPIEVGMLSRFCTPKEQEKIVKGLKRGSVDIVVGTHKLLSKTIQFKDLGLLIVDEEQRFGVGQKEKLKERFPTVDSLTLTATPIPRTLNMAMTGIRDMSVIEEAPQDRHPVQSYVIEHNMEVITQAMEKELRRGGQVYYLYNRTETIDKKAFEIKTLMPDAVVDVGHGKMSEDELSEAWRKLLEGETDIFVCTTIIETGVDVPNVNTLIIEDADRMGLSQLHQIRGRVGRSSRRASAYFTFRRGKQLTEIADRRLSAIREYTEFGSGFKIAMRDLELRGAGNILGSQQHGHMEAVGYDMYLKLLAQAVSKEKGEIEQIPDKDCLIDLQIDANIPNSYIGSLPQKLSMYRRIAEIRKQDDADDVVDELIDRFGEPPESVMGLINISLLRNIAIDNFVTEIGHQGNNLLIYTDVLDMRMISAISNMMRGRITISTAGKTHFKVKILKGQSQLEVLKQVLALMSLAREKYNEKKEMESK